MKKLKQLTAVFLTVIMALSVLTVAPFTVGAVENITASVSGEFTSGNYKYTVYDDGTAGITDYLGNETNIVTPKTLGGHKVTEICEDSFYNCTASTITISEGVTLIERLAFERCKNLTQLNLPASLWCIDDTRNFVLYSDNLVEINVSSNSETYSSQNGVLFSKDKATLYFYPQAKSGESYTIPNTVNNIQPAAFSDNTKYLKHINIGANLENIFGYFYCKNLESINVDNNNKNYSSEDGVLFNKNKTILFTYPRHKNTAKYIIPNTVEDCYGLNGCTTIEEITFSNKMNLIRLADYAYSTNLKKINLSNSITSIGDGAFFECTKLTSVTIPKTVTTIGREAFGYYGYHEKVGNFTISGYPGSAAEQYAKDNGFTFISLDAKVTPTSIRLNQTSLTLGAGESYTLTKSVSPSNASTTYTWSSSNTSVATVSNGKVTAKKSGTAYITVKTSNGKTAQCKVTVKPAPTSVKTNPASVTLGVGEKYTISESTNSGTYANASNLKWSTSNSSVATVTKGSGNKATVTAKGVGTAYVKITLYNGKTAQCKVTVKPAPTSVKTNPASVTLGVGEKYTISESTNSGTYANASNLKWSTSNSSVATVTKGSGNKATVTAKGVGTAYVKITLYNGKTAQCKVTVKPAPSSVKSYPASVTLGKGENYTIAAGTNSGSWSTTYTWSSSNNSVATVTGTSANKAKITAKGTGTATITIRTFNGKTATCKVTVKSAPSSVKVNPSNITLKKGASYTISESTNSGTYANASNLKWSTSNSSVATVTKGSGNKATITAKSKGTAYIKITLYNGKTAQCKVTVK